jgi:hypothetical protein
MKRFLLCLLFLAAILPEADAQLAVGIQIKRRLFILNEPVIANVAITNNTGHDITLEDTEEGGQWFRFQIVASDGRMVPPRDNNYRLDPLSIRAGETARRSVNLNELYTLGDFGAYKVTASIFLPERGKYYASRAEVMELTEGRTIWKQTVGVPESAQGAGGQRTFTLLTLQMDKGRMLYVRVEGEDGTVYACYNLGRMVEGFPPEAKFDRGNNLYILQLVGQKTYSLAHVGLNGDLYRQSTYVTPKRQPYLRRLEDGTLQIVGAVRQQEPVASLAGKEAADTPKLSDRPPGLPK